MIIPVVLLVAIVIFTMMYFTPGDPAEIILGAGATQAEIDYLRTQMGLNDPYFVQLGRFMYQTFIQFDLGNSYATGLPIANELASKFSITLVLSFSAMLLEVVIGIPLGIIAATHKGKFADHLSMLIALVGISAPSFWIGIQLILIFALKLGVLPVYGITKWTGWILPIFVNALRGIAQMARQSRSSMLEVIRADYITTSRAIGLSEHKLTFRYALPNALIPVIQTLGSSFGLSLGGTVVIENVFSIPGIGQYMVKALSSRDYAVVQSTTIILAIAFSIVMLFVDVAFGFVDPKIKAQYEGQVRKPRRSRGGSGHV